ncbi:MAG: RNA-guided endonuclease InsQ/TnpB family protein [Candidatus Dormibacteria bacterium]
MRFRDPQDVKFRRTSRRWGEVKIQGVGWIRVRVHRPLLGSRITSAAVAIEPDGKMFISLLCERHKRQPTVPLAEAGSVAGVDRGVAVAVATSDGEIITRENWRPKERERLRRLERSRERRKVARTEYNKQAKKAGQAIREHASKRQGKVGRAIAAMHARARRRRQDFNEQMSSDLAKNHGLVVFEDLHIQAMTASAKGTAEAPGSNVRQKAGLNGSILNQGWGELAVRTADKVARHGHRTMSVPAPYTSQTCPDCGHVSADSRATRSMFVCVQCGHQGHADLVAARNIRERGIKLALAGGTPVTARQGTSLGPDLPGVESGADTGRGNGNQETDCITVREVA